MSPSVITHPLISLAFCYHILRHFAIPVFPLYFSPIILPATRFLCVSLPSCLVASTLFFLTIAIISEYRFVLLGQQLILIGSGFGTDVALELLFWCRCGSKPLLPIFGLSRSFGNVSYSRVKAFHHTASKPFVILRQPKIISRSLGFGFNHKFAPPLCKLRSGFVLHILLIDPPRNSYVSDPLVLL